MFYAATLEGYCVNLRTSLSTFIRHSVLNPFFEERPIHFLNSTSGHLVSLEGELSSEHLSSPKILEKNL